MIRIREKDILFIAINLVLFLSWCSFIFLREATQICVIAMSNPEPTIQEGMVYLLYTSSQISMLIAGTIVFLIDCWWLYRIIRDYQKGYWKENL